MQNKVLISEIFESIQGEGPYVGINQAFIRFSKCNLKCNYCDTDFGSNLKAYSPEELAEEINKYKNIHSISLTGGEPLCESNFLKHFLPLCNEKIYLETNGTLYKELKDIIRFIDIISMDIKLPSCSNLKDLFFYHNEFIKVAVENKKEIFAKIVFDENIQQDEISKSITLVEKYNITLVLQPKMDGEKLKISSSTINKIYYDFLKIYKNTRLIPQTHKFLNLK